MWKKSLLVVCLALALGAALVLAKAGPPKTHAGDNSVTFYDLHLDEPGQKQKIEATVHNLIGIDEVVYNTKKDSVSVMFEYGTMRREWIEKAFESAGLPIHLNP